MNDNENKNEYRNEYESIDFTRENEEQNFVNAAEAYGIEQPAAGTRSAERKPGFGKKLIALLLAGLLFGAAAAGAFKGVTTLLDRGESEEKSSVSAQSGASDKPAADTTPVYYTSSAQKSSQSLDVSDIAEGMMPAMVSITNVSVQEVQSYFGFFGRNRTQLQESRSSGTGILIGKNDSELLIVTNNHVVDGATTLTVCFFDNEAYAAEIKGTDPDNDLAVIAVKRSDIKAETASVIKFAVLGDSNSLKVGQQVVAIGNALGYGQSVTTGIVSALDRRIDTADAAMIQTDAAINPGNSGGALLNMNGEVIGINSAKFSSTEVEGMGYAISVSDAMPIIENLMERTTRTKVAAASASWIGVDGEDITSSISSSYGIPRGVYITSMASDSPLYRAGILPKSVITHFDGVRITSLKNLENRLEYYAAGETVQFTVQVIESNSYVEKTVTVTLGSAAAHTQSGYYGYGR